VQLSITPSVAAALIAGDFRVIGVDPRRMRCSDVSCSRRWNGLSCTGHSSPLACRSRRWPRMASSASSTPAGAVESEFIEQFVIHAELSPRFAGEAVQQARLQGMSTFTVVVRACRATRAVTTDWRARDVRSADDPDVQTVFAILSGPIDTESKNRYVEFLMQSGKAP
jgi:hypothetical protein